MSYSNWLKTHSEKHKKIIEKLLKNSLNKNEIIDYFEYENLKRSEPDFCPLFSKNRKCHDIEYLNCYLCGCPNFRFNNQTLNSDCNINSKDGKKFIKNTITYQNCIDCTTPHSKEYIKKYFSLNWSEIMDKSQID